MMNSIFHNASAAVFAVTLLTGTAFAAGGDVGGAANASGDANVNNASPNVVPNAAGQNGVPGTKSVTGANADVGASTMGKSEAELPNNDAGTPINNGRTGTVGEPRQLVPHNSQQ